MKKLFLIIMILGCINANAQIKKVLLQASGLTCSMCSNSINKALQTLSFVDKIEPDIETSSFEITFKPGSNVDFDAIKEKVEKAGFSVAGFKAVVDFANEHVQSGTKVTVGNISFYILNTKEQTLNGNTSLKVLNKGFVSSKEYKKYAASISTPQKSVYYASI